VKRSIQKGDEAVSPLWVWSDDDGQACFRVYARDGCAVVVATGEVDLATAEALREAVGTAAHAADRIVVDLASVTFIDMYGFSALLSVRPRRHPHGPVSLVRPAPMVRKVVRMARLDEVFPIYNSLIEALDPSHGQSNDW
jgi:anti-sigma B factor antagonist